MNKGTLNVNVDNILPVIKKFLYSDHEIFLRELVSNAVDACQKLIHLQKSDQTTETEKALKVKIILDKEAKTITISDNGLGMTEEEIVKYINNIAFSGAKEFAEKFDEGKDSIIGSFGLGFYSSFMVSDKVEIISKSHQKGSKAVHWECDGSSEYSTSPADKKTTGTDIIMHISEEGKEFLEESKLEGLVNKYLRFMPIPIEFGEEEKEVDGKKEKFPKIVNNTTPAWIKQPKDLSDEDYKNFYKELYPTKFDEPLFHIHIHIDHPFQLNGVLYFPKIGQFIQDSREKVKLYQKQVYVTENLQDILPEFLGLMHGVIDSTDIPLNVSRSSLQADTTVKKIAGHISKKVADKLASLFKTDRKSFESKWNDIQVITAYGMLSDEKFYDKVTKIFLYKDSEGNHYTLDELKEKQKDFQTNKDNKFVLLYTNDFEEHHLIIEKLKDKNYKAVLLNIPFVSHLVQSLESKEDILCKKVDSDTINKLIEKEEEVASILNEDEKKKLEEVVKTSIDNQNAVVQIEDGETTDMPISITHPEFMRRMKDMSQMGNSMGMNNFPDSYQVVVNANHPSISKILKDTDAEKQKSEILYFYDLARLSQNMLKGKDLSEFIQKTISHKK